MDEHYPISSERYGALGQWLGLNASDETQLQLTEDILNIFSIADQTGSLLLPTVLDEMPHRFGYLYEWIQRYMGIYQNFLAQQNKNGVAQAIQERIYQVLLDPAESAERRQQALGFFVSQAGGHIVSAINTFADNNPEVGYGTSLDGIDEPPSTDHHEARTDISSALNGISLDYDGPILAGFMRYLKLIPDFFQKSNDTRKMKIRTDLQRDLSAQIAQILSVPARWITDGRYRHYARQIELGLRTTASEADLDGIRFLPVMQPLFPRTLTASDVQLYCATNGTIHLLLTDLEKGVEMNKRQGGYIHQNVSADTIQIIAQKKLMHSFEQIIINALQKARYPFAELHDTDTVIVQERMFDSSAEEAEVPSVAVGVEQEDQWMLAAAVTAAFQVLSWRQQEVLRLRYNLDGRGFLTQEQVAELLEVTRGRVYQIETEALDKLFHSERGQELLDFY